MIMSNILLPKPALGTSLQVGHMLAHGLIGNYLFNEGAGLTVRNSSLEHNHGVITNAGGAAWVGNGLELNSNSNDRVQVGPASIAELIGPQGSVGILFDSKSAVAAGSTNAPFFHNTGSGDFFRFVRSTDTELLLAMNDAGGSTRTFTVPDLWDGQTHFVWLTWSRIGSTLFMWCYVDGILVDSDTSVAMEPPASQTGAFLNIGGDSLATNTISGVIGSAFIYNRVLSASEIRQAYIYQHNLLFPDPNEIALRGAFVAAPPAATVGWWGWGWNP